jgi:excisionase family DNA binding protein
MIDLNRTNGIDRQLGWKLAYKPSEAAAMLSISERSLWSLMKLGKISPIKVGRSVRYPHAELERYLSQQLEEARDAQSQPVAISS